MYQSVLTVQSSPVQSIACVVSVSRTSYRFFELPKYLVSLIEGGNELLSEVGGASSFVWLVALVWIGSLRVALDAVIPVFFLCWLELS